MDFDQEYSRQRRLNQADPKDNFAKQRRELLEARKEKEKGNALSSRLNGQIGLRLKLTKIDFESEKQFKQTITTILNALESRSQGHVDCYFKTQETDSNEILETAGIQSFSLLLICDDLRGLNSLRHQVNELGTYSLPWIGPMVVFAQSVRKEFEENKTFKRQTSCPGQFARITLRVAPNGRKDCDFDLGPEARGEFLNSKGQDIHGCVGAVKTEIADWVKNRGLEGIHFNLLRGLYHEVDSRPLSFTVVTRKLLKAKLERLTEAQLEPLMTIDWQFPRSHESTVESLYIPEFEDIHTIADLGAQQRIEGLVLLSKVLRWHLKGDLAVDLHLEFHSNVPASKNSEGITLDLIDWNEIRPNSINV